jgi:hypothetical protein
MLLDEKNIDLLIKCPKSIVNPPTKEFKEDRGHMKKNFTMRSGDGLLNFRGFIRYNKKFIENFSVGMDYKHRDENTSICLIRLNGSHGENREVAHHNKFHIHRTTEETMVSGQRPESHIEITDQYSSISEAVQVFIDLINLDAEDKIKYFPKKITYYNNNE